MIIACIYPPGRGGTLDAQDVSLCDADTIEEALESRYFDRELKKVGYAVPRGDDGVAVVYHPEMNHGHVSAGLFRKLAEFHLVAR